MGRNAPSAANGFGHRCGEPDETPMLFGELEKGINAITAIAPQRIQNWVRARAGPIGVSLRSAGIDPAASSLDAADGTRSDAKSDDAPERGR
jgi:hypothetical protein